MIQKMDSLKSKANDKPNVFFKYTDFIIINILYNLSTKRLLVL